MTSIREFWRTSFGGRNAGGHAPALAASCTVALSSAVLSSAFCRSRLVRSTIDRLRSTVSSPRALLAATVPLALTANIASTLSTYPHTLSYFNELAGGPMNGPAHLLDANVDWGQDLLYLKRWYVTLPDTQPLHLEFIGSISSTTAGISSDRVPTSADAIAGSFASGDNLIPPAGWYAISANALHGYDHPDPRNGRFAWIRSTVPQASAGYSILLHYIPETLPID